jgi:hypothetical protein
VIKAEASQFILASPLIWVEIIVYSVVGKVWAKPKIWANQAVSVQSWDRKPFICLGRTVGTQNLWWQIREISSKVLGHPDEMTGGEIRAEASMPQPV